MSDDLRNIQQNLIIFNSFLTPFEYFQDIYNRVFAFHKISKWKLD